MTMVESERELQRRIAELQGSDPEKAAELTEIWEALQVLEELLSELEDHELPGQTLEIDSFAGGRYARCLAHIRSRLKSELGLR